MAFLEMFNMSITAGWMILAVVLLRPLLRRAPKWIRYILWLLVAMRLVIPFSFESVTSLVPSTETIPEMTIYYDSSKVPTIHSGIETFNSTVNPIITDTYATTVTPESTSSPAADLIHIISTVWLCGIAAMLLYCIISYAVLRHKVRTAAPLRDNIKICDNINSPFILGMIRPKIYIPSNITEDQLAAVEAHERMHIRHGDHLWKILGFVILSVYWWNPLIWIAYILFCRDIELICDEAVVRKMEQSDRTAYSEALLSFHMPRRLVSACPLAFGEVGVKARIKSVLNYRKPALWIIIASLVICTVTAVCLLTDPVEKDDPFKYDMIVVETWDGKQDTEDAFITITVEKGASYILPGYGDVEKIVCTIDSVNNEKKTVTLKLDQPLCREKTEEETDTVTLLLDHLAYDGLGHDKVTLTTPDNSGLMYSFTHAMINGAPFQDGVEEEEITIDKLIEDGLIPDPSEYKDRSVTARLFGYVNPDGRNYQNSNNDKAYSIYEVLKVEYFTPVDPFEVPDTEPIRVVFTDKNGMNDEYTVYDDDTVIYKMGDGEPLYFQAANGIFNSIRIREEKDNNVYKGYGSATLPAGDPVKEANTFSVDGRVYTLEYSKTAACYVLEQYSTGSFASVARPLGLTPSYPIQTNLKDYTLSVDKTDADNPKLIAEYECKKVSYPVKYDSAAKKPFLENPDGNTDFQLFVPTKAAGTISTPEYETGKTMETVSITGADVSGSCAFCMVVNSSKLGAYRATYIPKEVYNVYAATDEDGNVQIVAEKGDKIYRMDVEVSEDKLLLVDPPADFGEAYVYANSKIPDDAILFEYADLDGSIPSKLDRVYITEGPLSGRYSFNITVKGDDYSFIGTYAYDTYCDLEFVKLGTHLLQLKMTSSDSTVSLYDVNVDTVTHNVTLTLAEGDDILQRIYAVDESEKYKLFYLYTSESADIDGDGVKETVTVGPGIYSGLSSFSITIQDGDSKIGPVSYVSDSISQTLVIGEDGKLRLRAEYEDEVIFYDIMPDSGGILADKSGVGVK